MGEISEGGGPTNLTLSAAGLTIIYTAEKSKGCRHGGNGTRGFEGKKVYESQHAIVVSCFGKAWELTVDAPVLSPSTLEDGFLCCN